jgi:ribosomal protein S25
MSKRPYYSKAQKALREVTDEEAEREYDRQQRERREQERVNKAIEALAESCNRMGGEEKNMERIAVSFIRQHRTLQASMIRVLLKFLAWYGGLGEEDYDLRNSAAVKACRELLPQSVVDGVHIPFI